MNTYKILLLSFVFFVSFQTGWAQTDKKEQRKIERAEKKRLKEENKKKAQELVLDLVEDRTFVLEASTLAGRYGQQYIVSPSTNFVKVEGNQVIIQTSNSFGFGYNGLGGITINGNITDYQISKGKNGVSVFIQFTDPILGHSSLYLNVQENGISRATVSGNWGARATFQGQFVALEDARVFRGRSII